MADACFSFSKGVKDVKMNLLGIKKEIRELKNSIIWKQELVCRAFILGAEDSLTEEEIEAYRQNHPHTRVTVLNWKDCGQVPTD